MTPRLAHTCVALLAFLLIARAEPPAANPFENEIAAYEAADKLHPPPQGAIVFTGASGIRLWKTLAEDFPGLTVLNCSFGGSQLADSIHFAELSCPFVETTEDTKSGCLGAREPLEQRCDAR